MTENRFEVEGYETEAKLSRIIEELGLGENFTVYEEDKEFFEELESAEYITDSRGDDWTRGDDYAIACENEGELFFIYVDYHNLQIETYIEDTDLAFLKEVERIRG
jgi:hypothetical protein